MHAPTRSLPLLALALLLSTTGCSSLDGLLSGLDKPSADIADVRLQDLSLEGADLVFDVEVLNPYAFDLPVAALDYKLASAGRQFLSGSTAGSASIPARGRGTVPMAARVPFADMLGILSDVRPGAVVPYDAELGLRLDVPGADQLRIPLSDSGSLPVPAVPKVAISNLTWERLDLTGASARVDLDIENTNTFAVAVENLDYLFSLGGKRLAGAKVAGPTRLEPGGAAPMSLNFDFTPSSLGLAAFEMLRGSSASYSMEGTMDLGTPFGPLSTPFRSTGTTPMKR